MFTTFAFAFVVRKCCVVRVPVHPSKLWLLLLSWLQLRWWSRAPLSIPRGAGDAGACEASDSHDNARWLTFNNWNAGTREHIETGIEEQRALHIPENITPASRKRIARLFGAH